MTGTAESSGNTPIDPVTERTQLLAERYADEVEREVRKFLGDITLKEEVVEDIIAKKRRLAVVRVHYARENGTMNDERSTGPGVTLYLRLPAYADRHSPGRSFDDLREEAGRWDMAFDLYSIDAGEDQIDVAWYRWKLPDAAYVYDEPLDRIMIVDGAKFDEFGDIDSKMAHVRLSTSNVVRIEGSNGDLWQNPRFRLPQSEITVPTET
ncbi:MAG TPA: hypothetical protein VLE51_00515 [Candidatus Saccharimonadales bacterium]|nr:hypothetical protein [Candidatus Saccharimonadales bacterium]